MDGWMDGWMDRWMDGWMDRWVGGRAGYDQFTTFMTLTSTNFLSLLHEMRSYAPLAFLPWDELALLRFWVFRSVGWLSRFFAWPVGIEVA
jgi:hypothetical protein